MVPSIELRMFERVSASFTAQSENERSKDCHRSKATIFISFEMNRLIEFSKYPIASVGASVLGAAENSYSTCVNETQNSNVSFAGDSYKSSARNEYHTKCFAPR